MNKESRLVDKDLLDWFFNYVIDKLNEDKELSNYYYDIWNWCLIKSNELQKQMKLLDNSKFITKQILDDNPKQ